MSHQFHSQDTNVIQYMQINKCNTTYKQSQRQKSYDHLNRCQKSDIIQHSFIIKALKKLEIEGKYLNKIKSMYDKPIATITLSGKKTNHFLQSGMRQGVHSPHGYSI
jgi:hypothetical protein